MYSTYKLNKQGDNIQTWSTLSPILYESIVPCLVLTVASWPAYRFLRRQVRWLGISTDAVIHTVKGFSLVCEAEVDVFFLELPCFPYDPADVGNLISVPLPFLNPACTSVSSQFAYCWSLAWRIFSIVFLACEMSAVGGSLNILWHCLSLGLEWKLTFSSPVATAELSKFAGILSAALSEHHLHYLYS